ncbi:MAG: MFS transporter [Anaerolineae bacterium]|nr:MFS transporter [Anaerolineae bacterium]
MSQDAHRAVDGRRIPLSASRRRAVVRIAYHIWLSVKVALTLPPTVPVERIRPLRLFLLDGALSSVSDHIMLTFVPLFALTLGASNFQLGMLAAVASLSGALALLPARSLSARYPDWRQPIILLATGLVRLVYLGIALLPWVAPREVWILVLIGLWAVHALLTNLVNPTWAAFSASLVPRGVRSSYLHVRKDAMSVAAIVALPVAGLLIRWGDHLAGYQVGFMAAFLIGLAGLVAFSRIPRVAGEPSSLPASEASSSVWQVLLRNRPLFAFCTVGFLWNLSLQIAGPFLNIYLLTGLHATTFGVGVLVAISLLFGFASSHVVTDVVRYRGALWSLRVTSLLIPTIPWAWALVTAVWQVVFLNAIAGVLWGAYNLATFRMLMTLTPGPDRHRMATIYQAFIYFGACAGPLIGGMLADRMGFKPVFLLSGAGRLLAALLLWILIREPTQPLARPVQT